MNIDIRNISAEEAYPLRHKILRPQQTVEECQYPNDFIDDAVHIGAFINNELEGIVSIYPETEKGNVSQRSVWRLRGMATSEKTRGLGLGKLLVFEALREAGERGGETMWCNARSHASGFYSKVGFEKKGDEFIIDGIGPHYVMSKDIADRRIVGTLITEKPTSFAFAITMMGLLFITLFSQFYWMDPWGISDYFPAVKSDIYSSGEVWRIFTAIFIHADLGHLLSNMYMLGIFSFFITSYFGVRVYPFLSLLFAGLVNLVAVYTYAPNVRLIGASGLVYLLGGFWLTMYFLIQRQYRLFSRILRILGVGLMVFFPSSFVPETSYRTHAIGFIFGVAMALIYFMGNKKEIRSHEKYKISSP